MAPDADNSFVQNFQLFHIKLQPGAKSLSHFDLPRLGPPALPELGSHTGNNASVECMPMQLFRNAHPQNLPRILMLYLTGSCQSHYCSLSSLIRLDLLDQRAPSCFPIINLLDGRILDPQGNDLALT